MSTWNKWADKTWIICEQGEFGVPVSGDVVIADAWKMSKIGGKNELNLTDFLKYLRGLSSESISKEGSTLLEISTRNHA